MIVLFTEMSPGLKVCDRTIGINPVEKKSEFPNKNHFKILTSLDVLLTSPEIHLLGTAAFVSEVYNSVKPLIISFHDDLDLVAYPVLRSSLAALLFISCTLVSCIFEFLPAASFAKKKPALVTCRLFLTFQSSGFLSCVAAELQ